MDRLKQRNALKRKRLELIDNLQSLYKNGFDKLNEDELGSIGIAKLTQLMIQSKDAAIELLQTEVEKTIITKAPNRL